MRVLVTGASGFIGAHLVRYLLGSGVPTAALVRSESRCWRLDPWPESLVRIVGDLRDPGDLADRLSSFGPDVVVHLAWSGVQNRHRNEPAQVRDNLLSAMSLFSALQHTGCTAWVGMGSQAEYGPLNRVATEDDPTDPTTLYGVAKLCTYLLLRRLCADASMRLAWLRLFSAYGPMDDPGWLIPYAALALLRGERPSMTEGAQLWDYLYVRDVAEALFLVAESTSASGVFNLGSGHARTVRSVVEAVRDRVNPLLPLGFGEVPYRPDQVMHLEADSERLRRAVSWSPRVPLEEGLDMTIEWYREHRDRYS